MDSKELLDVADSAAAAAHASAVAGKAVMGGAAAGAAGFAISGELLGLGGFLVALVGMLVQAYYRHKEFKLREAVSRAQVERLSRGGSELNDLGEDG